jgi:lipopolysaccharide transport system permease protein
LREKNYWGDLWRYRELFYFIAWRDILICYKQTVVGVAWALIRPFVAMVLFTVILGKLAKLPSGGVPYPLLVFCGLLPWQLFVNSFAESGNSLIANSSLISKTYFPRLIVPAASVVVGLLDFLISAIFLGVLLVWYRFLPDWRVLAIPLFVLIAAVMLFGVGLLIAALTVKYRDFRLIVPFIMQFGLYVTPVGLSSEIVPEKWRLLYSLNPLVGVIDGFRRGNFSRPDAARRSGFVCFARSGRRIALARNMVFSEDGNEPLQTLFSADQRLVCAGPREIPSNCERCDVRFGNCVPGRDVDDSWNYV